MANFEGRLRRAEEVLTRVADGHLGERLDIRDQEDALTGLEMGINFLIVDLRQTAQQNHEQRAELQARLGMIERQADAIRALTTPVMEIWDDVLVLPVVGALDSARAAEITNHLLAAIAERGARCVIVDVTGVEGVDTTTADALLKVARAAALLGTKCVLTGLGPHVAQTLVAIGADLSEITTLQNLKQGLLHCLRFLEAKDGAARAAGSGRTRSARG